MSRIPKLELDIGSRSKSKEGPWILDQGQSRKKLGPELRLRSRIEYVVEVESQISSRRQVSYVNANTLIFTNAFPRM